MSWFDLGGKCMRAELILFLQFNLWTRLIWKVGFFFIWVRVNSGWSQIHYQYIGMDGSLSPAASRADGRTYVRASPKSHAWARVGEVSTGRPGGRAVGPCHPRATSWNISTLIDAELRTREFSRDLRAKAALSPSIELFF